jgi:hypothetical protein
LQGGGRGIQFRTDITQRHIDDGGVQHNDEESEKDGDERFALTQCNQLLFHLPRSAGPEPVEKILPEGKIMPVLFGTGRTVGNLSC